MVIVFIYVLEGYRQWNYWICKMIDYLKDSILRLDSTLKIPQKTNANQYDDGKYQVKHRCVYNEAI